MNEEEYGKRGRQEQEEERLERGKSERCFLSKTCTVESESPIVVRSRCFQTETSLKMVLVAETSC